MRYKTEFRIHMDVVGMDKNIDQRIAFEKQVAATRLGNLIAGNIGFDEKPYEGKHFKLEVEAFAKKDWLDFKQKLRSYIESAEKTGLATFNLIVVGKILKELETKGFPELENKIS